MNDLLDPLAGIARLVNAETRSISAENPRGAKSGGAQASPGDDSHCAPAARDLGKGWKVRPCLRDIQPGQTMTLADIAGPGVVQHIWCTADPALLRGIMLRAYYNDLSDPSIQSPLGDFFANGVNGLATVNSLPVAVNPRGGMNSYWPMPFRNRFRIEIANESQQTIRELYYQITYALGEIPDDAAYFHASWRRATTNRQRPEHVILPGAMGRGHYVGTYIVWSQFDTGWWGEGEVKFFIDGDPPDKPTICGTGTEDYFGGAWAFAGIEPGNQLPAPFSGPFLGYPQARCIAATRHGRSGPMHGLYRWHIPDPVRFKRDLRISIQALGWQANDAFQPLADDIASVAYWYQTPPSGLLEAPPEANRRRS
ncbi:MAG: DUF2961 domain-containing protein [Planctomycetota bacterium]|nr:DUF2961 domain-containing protein [Planctomycetota bacterium]